MAGIWLPDAPPSSAGAADDEFADASGGVPSGWTEWDHGSLLTVDEDMGGLELTYAATTGQKSGGLYKAIPAGDFTIWTKVSVSAVVNYQSWSGLALYENGATDSADVRGVVLEVEAGQVSITVTSWAQWNSINADVVTRVVSVDSWPMHCYLRIRHTASSSTYSFDFSTDGITWQQVYTTTSLGITPAHFGPFVGVNVPDFETVARFAFFRYVASDVGITGLMQGDRVTFPAAQASNHNRLLLLGVG